MNYDIEKLIDAAREVRERAYAPYSHFAVGAALLDSEGTLHTGCNVENISFGLTLCAERGAVMAAVARGRRNFVALAIIADSDIPLSPCGACRQFLAEFAPDLPIISANLTGARVSLSLSQLLPRAKTGILNTGE
jgi:cytidine deaminase